ncbi:MAG: hypothetical protein JRI32_04540 [Deltaproteobacteria bacterium]|nr:hypothetical protein [Deltaproteobacteria bacterium]
MILATIGNIKDAENVGIAVLDKYGGSGGLTSKLQEIAFHIQNLARGLVSQQHRADGCYAKYNEADPAT